MSTSHVLHLLPNAHLDPVWLWDWREGMNEGIITTRTVQMFLRGKPVFGVAGLHAGIYRERVVPRRGGNGPDSMIAYEAAPGGEVIVSGAEAWTPRCLPSAGWHTGKARIPIVEGISSRALHPHSRAGGL